MTLSNFRISSIPFTPAFAQDDPADARLLACSSESGEGVGNGGEEPGNWVKLPRRKQRKPTILLPLATIGKLIELFPKPTKTVVTLIVFGSLCIGEELALRWRHIHADRITVEERVHEGEFDDVKTDAGERQVPLDKCGLMMSALIGRWNASKHRHADDLVFSTRKGGTLGRRNLLRHIKAAATQLGLSQAVDFRSFGTMRSSSCCVRVRGRRLSGTTWATPISM